jgi:hypothetical protein
VLASLVRLFVLRLPAVAAGSWAVLGGEAGWPFFLDLAAAGRGSVGATVSAIGATRRKE